MADNFDLRKYLAENRLTSNHQLQESSQEAWMKWLEKTNPVQKYGENMYNFKEAIKQKALALNTPEIISWLEKINPYQKYTSIYSFKEAVKQKILSLK